MQLLQGDCLELMKEIPDGSVDMVLCDLPYGTTQNKWDIRIPFESLWAQWHRVCKENAAVLLFGQTPFTADLVNSNRKEFRYEWVYEKTNATGFLNANKMPLKAHEAVNVFYQKLPVYNPQFENGKPYKKASRKKSSSNYHGDINRYPIVNYDGKRYPRDLLRVHNSSFGTDKGFHPTQKSIALLEYFIRTYTNEGDTVLDNCMGSGSTGVACANTGRDFIGIELNEHYFQVAKERIEKAIAEKKQAASTDTNTVPA